MDIAPCPYCPDGGNATMACTDLENKNEYQVWCRECWAHGPHMATERFATLAWNVVSKAARGMELAAGETYVVTKDIAEYKVGQRVVFRWRTEDGKFNVFNPEGEGDMESAFSIRVLETVYFVSPIDPLPEDPFIHEDEHGNRSRTDLDGGFY